MSGQETLEGPSAPETSSTAEQETAEPVTSGPAAGQEAAGLPAPALSAGGPQAPGSSLGGQETSEPSFAAGPSDRTAGTSRSVGGQSRSASQTSVGPDSFRDSRRSRQRVGAAAPSSLTHQEIVNSLKDIGECVKAVENPDQLFCSAIAAELQRQPEDIKKRMKMEICRVVYG